MTTACQDAEGPLLNWGSYFTRATGQEFGCFISDASCLPEALFQKTESSTCTSKITESRLSRFSWKP